MIRDQKLWAWHIVAGLIILVLLGLHMVTMHLEGLVPLRVLNPVVGKAPIDWENVVARGKAVTMPVIYVLLLGAALFHGLYGFTNIVREANPPRWLARTVTALAVVVGLGLFALGSWAAVAAHLLARKL
ncbi:MAG TPA: hypothetical protein P5234_02610 [Thermoanaerobaculaceae bacterium]|nr:hypothetical protein [Thermoanaerobaculaceae bacterium]HRS15119.1 hypothetical protein [Thermoanaerobaculaceae bacterium]